MEEGHRRVRESNVMKELGSMRCNCTHIKERGTVDKELKYLLVARNSQ